MNNVVNQPSKARRAKRLWLALSFTLMAGLFGFQALANPAKEVSPVPPDTDIMDPWSRLDGGPGKYSS